MEKNNQAKGEGARKVERRREPRIEVEAKVKIRIPTKDSLATSQKKIIDLWAFTSELSAGGFRLLLPLRLERGLPVELELYLPHLNKILNLEAEVRWQQPSLVGGLYESGFEFKTLSPEDRISLLEFIYSHKIKRKPKGGKA